MKVLLLAPVLPTLVAAFGSTKSQCDDLPEEMDMMNIAFKPKSMGGKWPDLYFTKRWDGMDSSFGGSPLELDVQYPFQAVAPFLGQPGGGTPNHCPEDSPVDILPQTCPKVITKSDDGPFGPGHIPPHISYFAMRWAYLECEEDFTDWFDYDTHGCVVPPEKMLSLVRKYFPRDENGDVKYPSPKIPGTPTYWKYEFAHDGTNNHYCTDEYFANDGWTTYCPYNGEGKYRHPHLAWAALQQFIAHKYMPDLCGQMWDDSNYPASPDTSIAFPVMDSDDPQAMPVLVDGLVQWPGEEGRKKKDVQGVSELFQP